MRDFNLRFFESLVTSNFSFLRGASHAEEYIAQAYEIGLAGIALTDHNSLAGIVRGHTAATDRQLPFRIGCRLTIYQKIPSCVADEAKIDSKPYSLCETPLSLAVYPTDRASYGALCRLLSMGKLRAPKGHCHCLVEEFLEQLRNAGRGWAITLLPHDLIRTARSTSDVEDIQARYASLIEQCCSKHLLSIALTQEYDNPILPVIISRFAQRHQIPLLATADALMHVSERKSLHDILTCIRHGCTLAQAGFRIGKNGERCLKSPREIAHLFRATPHAVKRSLELLEATSGFSLSQLKYEYPEEVTPFGTTPIEHLKALTLSGAQKRYPEGIPEKVLTLLSEEFSLIAELRYEKYFLTCHDIVLFARSQGILCQGRGAAANSVVCFCLGITSVDPMQIDLLFARFVSRERNEPPDIDIDFEHERREEVIQYIYNRFGKERAGLGCAVITYRTRSAVREIGKVLGLGLEAVDAIAKLVHRWTSNAVPAEDLITVGLSPDNPLIQLTFALAKVLKGFPRHLTQHVGGFIICQHPLIETVPILNSAMDGRTIIEWDKDDIEALGMLKIDILALGMLTCIRKAFELIERSPTPHAKKLELHTIPQNDLLTYDRICAADTVGVFQIESRAQMSMLPRLKPRCLYDLVIEVAIVRPGPIQGNMVHPYLRRRAGLEKAHYPDERARAVLGKTLGVPIFQEQAMRLAIVLANFTPDEAEGLRRAMSAWKRDKGQIARFKARVLEGRRTNGYSEEFAETCMNQIKGFSEYGFPESHAASFALLAYTSAWLKTHYPVHFAAALLNSQPMGFYAPAQIVNDLERHGFEVLPIDITQSNWDCSVSYKTNGIPQLRLGLRLIKGLSLGDAEALIKVINTYGGQSISKSELQLLLPQLRDATAIATLETLIRADAFAGIGAELRETLWQLKALPKSTIPLEHALQQNTQASFQPRTLQQSMFDDFNRTGVSLRAHPVGIVREQLRKQGVLTVADIRLQVRDKTRRIKSSVKIAGIAFVKQRPPTAKGMLFISLEDETGVANLVLSPQIFEQYRRTLLMSSALQAEGILERVDAVLYIKVIKINSIESLVTNKQNVDFSVKSYSY